MPKVEKGIIMAGGRGTRLAPLTAVTSKHLLPIHDKPLIYYPLSILLLAKIRDILIVCNPEHVEQFRVLFGDGQGLGVSIKYCTQDSPRGIGDVFHLAEDFISNEPFMLALGDNIFWGSGLVNYLVNMVSADKGAQVLAYSVADPERFGVLSFEDAQVVSIDEKPLNPKSTWACTGIYVFDSSAGSRAASLKPSARGELEITDVLQSYIDSAELGFQKLGRGFFWLDAGTVEAIQQACEFVRVIENQQKIKIACLEEISLNNGWISPLEVKRLPNYNTDNPYFSYLREKTPIV